MKRKYIIFFENKDIEENTRKYNIKNSNIKQDLLTKRNIGNEDNGQNV